MKNKNTIWLAGILLLLIAGLIFFLSINEFNRSSKIIATSILAIAGFILFFLKERRKKIDIKNDIPVEDELTIKSKVYAGSKAFQISMFLWLVIFIFHESFTEPETMLGSGILGSAFIYGGCLLYFKTTQNFNNSNL